MFNYWEPTHFLNHGHGFQTWEYSPIYAIRSWAYIALHSLVTIVGWYLHLGLGSKEIEFYLLRIALGAVSAFCETRLFRTISSTLNIRIAISFLVIMATSPGMFHASVAYLPSSFTMYTTTLGMASFMDWSGSRLRTSQGIFTVGAGALLGWPFAAAMALPFAVEEVILAAISDRRSIDKLLMRTGDGIAATLLVLAGQVVVDTFFYKKTVIVPFNIVRYNLFSKAGGPDLYGTEAWHFYFRNLFLNFHVWFLLALISMPLILMQHFLKLSGKTKASHWRGVVFLSPFYLWLAIFTLQPHKEERFMYPAYPALALNASVSVFIILANFGSSDRRQAISKVPTQLRYAITLVCVASALIFSALRVVGTIKAYGAPLSIYRSLHDPDVARPSDTVCLGKEWYRFPSHYHLPQTMHAKFVKSEFSGLLPGEFNEASIAIGTSIEPPGMNSQNREDPGKYTQLRNCTFLVDLNLPSTKATDLEPNYLADTEHWERVKCLPFMDSSSTAFLGRLIWIPDLSFIPQKYKRVYGDYCLLKRRKIPGTLRKDPVPHIETLG